MREVRHVTTSTRVSSLSTSNPGSGEQSVMKSSQRIAVQDFLENKVSVAAPNQEEHFVRQFSEQEKFFVNVAEVFENELTKRVCAVLWLPLLAQVSCSG